MTFREIMEYHSENEEIFQEMKKNFKNIIPFVGAGLSRNYGYPLWGDFLKKLYSMLHTPDESIKKEIDSGSYIKAANDLESKLGLTRIYRKMAAVFSESLMQEKIGTAAGILPYLFPDTPVITTNYDSVLENLYEKQNKKFAGILMPYNRSIIDAANQRNLHMLLKLHGQVCGDAVDNKSVVFTEKQYNEAYSTGSDLVQALKDFSKSHILLFLGCSLTEDKTVSLLSDFFTPNRFHYAILSCTEAEIDRRLQQLADGPNIRAIVYPEGHHECVRIILEELLKSINPENYEKLLEHEPKFTPSSNRFVYNAKNIGFYGHEVELKKLGDFCSDSRPVLWWAITGPGGSGKSRLAYEFTKKMSDKGWSAVFLHDNNYNYINNISLEKDTLVVADYAQGHMEQIGNWLSSIKRTMPGLSIKLRLLILERNGKSSDNSGWLEALIRPISGFGNDFESDCYKKEWLYIDKLKKKDLKNIIKDFYKSQTNQTLSDENCKMLYSALKEVDETLQRPLFALFITDAFLHGEAPEKWDQESTLNVLYRKECSIWRNKLTDIIHDSDTEIIWKQLARLYAAVTVYGDADSEEIKEQFPIVWNNFLSALPEPREINAFDLLINSGLADSEADDDSGKKLHPLKPDLFGEYFVLKQMHDITCPGDIQEELLGNFHSIYAFIFLNRLLQDYPEKLEKMNWLIERLCSTEYTPEEWESPIPILFVQLLVMLETIQPANGLTKSAAIIHDLQKAHPEKSKLINEYGKSLVILTFRLPPDEAEKNNKFLKELQESHPEIPELIIYYAYSMSYLMLYKSLDEDEKIVEILLNLFQSYPKLHELIIPYAFSLTLLLCKQNGAAKSKTIETLWQLQKDHPDSPDLKKFYDEVVKDLKTLKCRQ